jgi:hypothetical protein
MSPPSKNLRKQDSVSTPYSVSSAQYKRNVAARRNGNSLRVAEPVSGDKAVEILKAAGIFYSDGTLNPRYA